jgi:hypothetical protein
MVVVVVIVTIGHCDSLGRAGVGYCCLSHGAGARSRGIDDDRCCVQGLGRSSPDAPAVKTGYPTLTGLQNQIEWVI